MAQIFLILSADLSYFLPYWNPLQVYVLVLLVHACHKSQVVICITSTTTLSMMCTYLCDYAQLVFCMLGYNANKNL